MPKIGNCQMLGHPITILFFKEDNNILRLQKSTCILLINIRHELIILQNGVCVMCMCASVCTLYIKKVV